MPAPRQCTLPTPCDRGYGPMRGCGLCRGNVHGGVVHARGGVALWRGWGIPLKGAALGSCQTRPSGDIRLPAPKKTTMELGLPEKNWRWTRTVKNTPDLRLHLTHATCNDLSYLVVTVGCHPSNTLRERETERES